MRVQKAFGCAMAASAAVAGYAFGGISNIVIVFLVIVGVGAAFFSKP